jgi:ribosomal protein S27AE
MASVFTDNVECPLCGVSTAHTDLNIHTNERQWDCERCGFHSHTRIAERAGKQFWEHTMELPMSKDGKVAWPKMQAVGGGTWNRKEFGVMPSYEAVPEVFGAEEAKADGQPAVQMTDLAGEGLGL